MGTLGGRSARARLSQERRSCSFSEACSSAEGEASSPLRLGRSLSRRARVAWTGVFLALFAAANDVWAWGDGRLSFLGFPWWVWTSAGLCVLLSLAFWLFGRALDREAT